MLDEHLTAYAAARQNLHALSASASADGNSWVRYADLLTTLEHLHDPDVLPSVTGPPALPRSTFYYTARAALIALRDRGFVDPLEASLLIGTLAEVWFDDPARDAGGGR